MTHAPKIAQVSIEHLPTEKEVDTFIGKRLRLRRIEFGLSQETLGKLIGVTFQQIQKYEKGINHLSAAKLYLFSKVLHVDVSYFYTELLPHPEGSTDDIMLVLGNQNHHHRATLEIMKGFNYVSAPVQHALANLISEIARPQKQAAKNNQQGD